MVIPLHITLRDVTQSAAVLAQVRGRLDAIERMHVDVARCQVTLEGPSANGGDEFIAQVSLDVPTVAAPVCEVRHGRNAGEAVGGAFHAVMRALADRAAARPVAKLTRS